VHTSLDSNLKVALDTIWRARDRRAAAQEAVRGLTPLDWLVLGAWDTAAVCATSGGTLRLAPPAEFSIEETSLLGPISGRVMEGAEGAAFLRFIDTNWSVRLTRTEAVPYSGEVSHDPVSLLLALQLLRDHLDSLTLHPVETRQHAIARQARDAGADETHYRSLMEWLPEILQFIGPDNTHAGSH
jgi:hypothetical protein